MPDHIQPGMQLLHQLLMNNVSHTFFSDYQ